jgi:hypothetical protein
MCFPYYDYVFKSCFSGELASGPPTVQGERGIERERHREREGGREREIEGVGERERQIANMST